MTYPEVSALAARGAEGAIIVSLVHRGTEGPVTVDVTFDADVRATEAATWTLGAEVPWAANGLEAPEAVKPMMGTVAVRGGRAVGVVLKPFSVMQLRVVPKP
jgi:hypothetical protein